MFNIEMTSNSDPNTKPCPECGSPIELDEDVCEDCALVDSDDYYDEDDGEFDE